MINFTNDNPVIADRISRIINYVYENHSGKITLDELAKKEHLSTYYLSHLIHDNMGISFQEFLCFARAEMSEIPLLQSSRRISQIAKDVGFSTTSYYEKFFVKWFGHTPEEHRTLFLPRVLSPENPEIIEPLSEVQTIGLLKRCLSTVSDYESSTSVIDSLHLKVDVIPEVTPLRKIQPDLEVVITHDDYHTMGERLFNMLYQLKASKVVLAVRKEDSNTTTTLITNRLTFSGYEVSVHFENSLDCRSSAGFDSIAAAIQIFQRFFSAKENSLHCRLRDQGDASTILKGESGVLTSGLIPKSSFYAYRLLQSIRGDLLYWGKYYYIIRDITENRTSYIIVVLNYNEEILHLPERCSGIFETNDIISDFRDELNIDFSLPVSAGQYIIAKYALTNTSSIFAHMSHLGFSEQLPLADEWIHLLSTEPQTQVYTDSIDDRLSLSISIAGAGINVVAISKVADK